MKRLMCAVTVVLGLLSLAIPSEAVAKQCCDDLEVIVEPQEVIVAHEGIFVLHGGHLLRMSQLARTSEGLLATIRETDRSVFQDGGVIQAVEVCHACGQLRFGPVCTNPECPYYGIY